ncbi:hypothetical protein NEUTE1DRAFT_139912 [Neurospora tetrasperma FGSC 2508]|uniref:Uncharacterized protein n=1 Tax=Neurospora tetrasperma (strain FGSC 2508 / ATCC MYA-4615 / P0657) TaxID=510951 RepID=F8MUI1_NEUT8|nr:uncharacterized protein NEUTE1DRAFT_139912 [Neurospora tetrasperma FGSC 2508]EGO55663.1 hypothetical protein NEUTE1DRAFT_139912 [Neurospora tetrasperma FGSC 2508]EGZ69089.1 hypothetical protein NEUTE2DRAFT_168733 [Neurospora tetrasperma FGSC 2509]
MLNYNQNDNINKVETDRNNNNIKKLENERDINTMRAETTMMRAETMASLKQQMRKNINDPHEVAAIVKFIREKNRLYNDQQVYALRFWYEQLHILYREAPRASLLSAEEIVDILIDKMTKPEFEIFNERLLLIRNHYPEKVRWHKKMEEGLGGGYGLKVQVWGAAYPGGEKFLSVEWLELTEEEKGFQWWW